MRVLHRSIVTKNIFIDPINSNGEYDVHVGIVTCNCH